MLEEVSGIIESADMVLVGLGEEFDDISFLKKDEKYTEDRKYIEENELLWILPEYNERFRNRNTQRLDEIRNALNKLAEILQNKNYFVVSTSTNNLLREIPWKEGRLVMPCGGSVLKQCSVGCDEVLEEVTEADEANIARFMEVLPSNASMKPVPELGGCPKCGKPLVFNNIYATNYNENGYLSQWQLYTKWLQGTLNKKVVILELGVGMKFPTVIRFPFEKIAFYNQKAVFYRVNETLYQMTEELKDKGVSISKNSIDWLRAM